MFNENEDMYRTVVSDSKPSTKLKYASGNKPSPKACNSAY